MFVAGCVSNAETIIDEGPNLYDGNRRIGRVLQFWDGVIAVWIPGIDAMAYYYFDGDMATLDSHSYLRAPLYSEESCSGSIYAYPSFFPGNIVVSIDGGETHAESYFFDFENQKNGVKTLSMAVGGDCESFIAETTNQALIKLQPSDIPAIIKNGARIF